MTPIIRYDIDSTSPGPTVLITAGVHGDEYEPILAVRRLHQLLNGKLLRGKLIAVPVVNTDAAARHTRTGSDGLDLARVCPGDKDGSCTLRSAHAVSDIISNEADFLIDLHTGGRILDIYPMTGYMLHADPDILEQQRAMARAFGLPVIWGTDALAEGRTLSVARDAGIPAIYAEFGGGSTVREHIVQAYVEGCINWLKLLKLVAGEPTQTTNKFTIEDNRPGQGHLQSKLPAPVKGIFKAAVAPGEQITRGSIWGVVFDPLSGSPVNVVADIDGMVLFVRADAIVQAGDSLGGILPLNF